MKDIQNEKNLQKGSSVLISLIVVALIIFALYHYGITFSMVANSVKGFFGF